jgi:hypothetical protein
MKKLCILTLAVAVVGLLTEPAAFAKGKKSKAPETQIVASDVYVQYDKNSNGMLEADEKDAIRKAFEADTTDTLLSQYDTNSDKKLSDDEIAAIPATKTEDASAAGGKHKKHKKNK